MQYWWVNQNQTYKHEIAGGFLWSPKVKANGAKNQFYDNMQLTEPGDIVLSFCDSHIKAVGIVMESAISAAKPDYGNAGGSWSDEGWLVEVEFSTLPDPIQPKAHIEALRPYLPKKYSPLQQNGDGQQSVYLAALPEEMAQQLISLIGKQYISSMKNISRGAIKSDTGGQELEMAIMGRTDIGPTTKECLVLSRRGQGQFKVNLRLNEQRCRITGTEDIKHLVASHIKPWSKSSDEEKLNGCNGLLLAPHIDHLFDAGYISFEDNGDLLISEYMGKKVLKLWGISPEHNAGPFTKEQAIFLEYHRKSVFRR